ncbi:DUF3108 domain-containing protein [Parabacteroides chinchillae]|uniref:DUF3108 domain-containing protein n=1 Tax=Parabacteroides chinchillae TaxID=871327 RepID=A0A8G2F3W6_9BACT|nr:DUF3108 domain-containing protein [Parabacteroides chinchillae]SEF72321.1 Protein of unknown function [Parabacteroides chinchillae]
MKEDNRHRKTQDVPECRSRVYLYILLLLLIGGVGYIRAQGLPTNRYFTHGERVDYDLYFKWGILMPKAGLATLSIKDSKYEGNSSWHYRLLFRTSGMMEKVFKMRDTIDCHFSYDDARLLFSSKRTNEGDYYLIDNLSFSYNEGNVSVRSHRYNLKTTKIDTILTAQGRMFDMLGATMYLRALDWDKMSYGDTFPFLIAIGRDLVNVSYRYSGQQIVERGDAKYRTRHFYIDIIDEAFTQNKEAAEVWIGDDQNHLPIKIRAKLKIGAAEVYYNSSYNLRYPLDCRVVFPKR